MNSRKLTDWWWIKLATTTDDLSFRNAIKEAIDEELAADHNVIFFGQDVAEAGGVFAVSPGLKEKFGDARVFDTPISELALASAAFGSAVAGMRPIVEIMFGDFLFLAMDSLVNQSAKYWYLSNEQKSIPLVVRSAVGGGVGFGPIHSQVPISWFLGIPGLKIIAPSTPNDAKCLLKAAIRDENPVLFFEHKGLYSTTEIREEQSGQEILGKGRIVRNGKDITLVSCMKGLADCLEAANMLSEVGISAEVIDLRSIRPMDKDLIQASFLKTRSLLVVEEGPITGGWAAEVIAIANEVSAGAGIKLWRIATENRPIPFSPALEKAFFPSAQMIFDSVREKHKK